MCGIAGAVNWGGFPTVERMAQVLEHRGPDDMGVEYFVPERVGLSHRRLSILDLSKNGHQPMSCSEGQLWIVFNGEIYNFQALRKELQARGRRFSSNSDTEVILQLYEEYGVGCVTRLNGMFAFAIFDRVRRTLLLARDHMGIKPLYYYDYAERLVFASEIKAILAAECCVREIDQQALYDYFTYSCIPCPRTIFKGIKQLPPAHILEVRLDTGQSALSRYWDAGVPLDDEGMVTPKDGFAYVRRLLADSVRSQLISDVPVGAFLSGGIDSRIMVGLMAEQAGRKPVKTFTVGFEGLGLEAYNEQTAARLASERFGTEHHETIINVDHPEEMLDLVRYFDQPFANPTAYLMHLISRQARSEVKVVLCGAGGDELFAGYPRYRAMELARLFRYMPNSAIHIMRALFRVFSDNYRTMTLQRARQFLDGLDTDFCRQFVNWTYYLNEHEKVKLLAPMLAGRTFEASVRIFANVFNKAALADLGNRVLATDVQTFLVDNLLEYTDKMSMSVGLEVRVPYLERALVEHSLSIPFKAKLRGKVTKIALRTACRDLLPENSEAIPKKGFVPPLAIWMRERLDKYFDRHMPERRVKSLGYFDFEYIQTLREIHRRGRCDYSYELFSIMMFDSWHRRHMEGTDTTYSM